MVTTVFATETGNKADNVITIGYLSEFVGIRDINAISKKGYLYDIFARISDYCDYTFEYKEYDNYYALVDALKNNEIQYFGPVTELATERWGLYSSMELTDTVVYLVKKKDGTLMYYNDYKRIDGKTVASYSESSFERYLNEYCDSKGISVNYVRGDISNYHELEADYYLVSSIDSKFDEYYSAINLKNLPLCVATTIENGNAKFNKDLMKAFENMVASDVSFLQKVHIKYFGGAISQRRTLTKEEVEMLKNHSFKVAFESGQEFFSYLNKDGEPEGIVIEMFREIATRYGMKIEYLPYRIDGEGENSQEYALKNADIMLSSLGKYVDFSADFSMSNTYMDIPSTLLVDESLYYSSDEKTKAKIGIARNLFMEPNATEGMPFDASLLLYDDIMQLNEDFNNDKIDGLFVPECAMPWARGEIDRSYFTLPTAATTPYKIWISNELGHDYIEIANVIFDHISSQAAEVIIVEEQSKYKSAPSLKEAIKENLLLVTSIITFIVFSLVFIYLRLVMNNAKKLKNIMEVDQVTGLLTISKFMPEMKKLLENSSPKEYYIISFDIDNFKVINQSYGFEKGNELLRAVANSMRKYANKDAIMCRLQNDIFVVIGRRSNVVEFNTDQVLFSQERCDEIMQNVGLNAILHFSTGVYVIENKDISYEKIVDNVRKARNISKTKHGNVMTVYSDELKLQTEKENEIYTSMEKALENREFFIVVQPKVELETGKLVGGEVLVRWEKADGTIVYPDEFIPLFEKNHFIVRLDSFVFEEACQLIKNAKIDLPHLSINVSAMTALSENIIETYMDILAKYGLKPEQFELELTESVLDYDFEKVREVFSRIKELGFSLSLDDFGKGASSLARINSIDVDTVKLDKGFITNNINKEKGNSVVANSIALAEDLGITTLAEGIETKEQLDLLVELGCELGQGYYFDKPLSVELFLARATVDSKKEYPRIVKVRQKIKKYLGDFENLPYGIAIAKNDPYSTIVKANRQFYEIIGHTKEGLAEKHGNRLTDVLVDNLYNIVKEQPVSEVDYDFVWDLRINTADGRTVWVTDYVHYDATQDLFIVTFFDSTDKIIMKDTRLSISAFESQKEALRYMSDLTSDYIIVSDVENEDVIFVNGNAMKILGFSCEDDWKGKKYFDVAFGRAYASYKEYYDMVNIKGYGSREYYNEHLGMYLHIENKIITVLDRKMRLNIITDITAKKKMESDMSIKTVLNECTECLYQATTTDTTATNDTAEVAFKNMLDTLMTYFNADRAYYYSFNEQYKIKDFYEVIAEGITESGHDSFDSIPLDLMEMFVQIIKQQGVIYIDTETMIKNLGLDAEKTEHLYSNYSKYDISSFIYGGIKNADGEVCGFIGVDNPKTNTQNTEIMSLLSRFIYAFISSMNARLIQLDAVKLEEIAKVNILEKCTEKLQNSENADEKITDILDMLREHYDAGSSFLMLMQDDRKNYDVVYESRQYDSFSRLIKSQNRPMNNIRRLISTLEGSVNFTVSSFADVDMLPEEREFFTKVGISNLYVSPMYEDNVLKALLCVSNPSIDSRSKALIHVVSKSINDYLETIIIKEKISLDLLTTLSNKMATEKTITNLLKEGTMGVLFIIDIDYFKNLNDTLGHIVGDVALVEIAHEIKKTFRSSDVVGRIGGDEFMVFCPNIIADEYISAKAETLCQKCKKTYEKDGMISEISTSIGVFRIDKKGKTFREVYEKADKALYNAKKNGKNQFCIMDDNDK